MECYNHLRAPAVGVCKVCGKAVCRKCARIYGSYVTCSTACEQKLASDTKTEFYKKKKEEPKKEEAQKPVKPPPPPPSAKKKVAKAPGTFPVFSLIGIGLLSYGIYTVLQGDDVGFVFLKVGSLFFCAMILIFLQLKFFNS